jgi:hypothetical protein
VARALLTENGSRLEWMVSQVGCGIVPTAVGLEEGAMGMEETEAMLVTAYHHLSLAAATLRADLELSNVHIPEVWRDRLEELRDRLERIERQVGRWVRGGRREERRVVRSL